MRENIDFARLNRGHNPIATALLVRVEAVLFSNDDFVFKQVLKLKGHSVTRNSRKSNGNTDLNRKHGWLCGVN